MVLDVAEALQEQGISAEVIDLRTLRPLDKETIFSSVAKTNRVVIIQEQHPMSSYGAYLSHLIATEMFDYLDAPVHVVSSLDCPMPYSKVLEEVILPSVEKIIHAVKGVLA